MCGHRQDGPPRHQAALLGTDEGTRPHCWIQVNVRPLPLLCPPATKVCLGGGRTLRSGGPPPGGFPVAPPFPPLLAPKHCPPPHRGGEPTSAAPCFSKPHGSSRDLGLPPGTRPRNASRPSFPKQSKTGALGTPGGQDLALSPLRPRFNPWSGNRHPTRSCCTPRPKTNQTKNMGTPGLRWPHLER